jgi:hypothetical protein
MRRNRHNFYVSALVLAATVLTGCSGGPKVTPDRAAQCVKQTFAYADLTRGMGDRAIAVMDANDEDGVHIGVYQSGMTATDRLGRFRVAPNGQIFLWEAENADWKLIGVCDE